jgi:hypothetical protein
MRRGACTSNPGRMRDDSKPWHDSILFELPSGHDAADLNCQLSLNRAAWTEHQVDTWVVGARFDAGNDLARLLRKVEAWVADRQLGAIRYHLDDTAYILEAGEIAWSTPGVAWSAAA